MHIFNILRRDCILYICSFLSHMETARFLTVSSEVSKVYTSIVKRRYVKWQVITRMPLCSRISYARCLEGYIFAGTECLRIMSVYDMIYIYHIKKQGSPISIIRKYRLFGTNKEISTLLRGFGFTGSSITKILQEAINVDMLCSLYPTEYIIARHAGYTCQSIEHILSHMSAPCTCDVNHRKIIA